MRKGADDDPVFRPQGLHDPVGIDSVDRKGEQSGSG